MNSTFLYGANVNANGIRQHYLRYGGTEGVRAGRPSERHDDRRGRDAKGGGSNSELGSEAHVLTPG